MQDNSLSKQNNYTMHKILTPVLFLLLSSALIAQSKKEIKKNKITSVTVTEVNGGKTINDSKTVYDGEGEVTEKAEYSKDGSLKKTMKYKMNNLGDVVEEEEYDEKNVLKEKTQIKYNALGDKKEELVYDAGNKLLKKHVYVYDAKGLKTERKTLDASGKLLSTKKYSYTFK